MTEHPTSLKVSVIIPTYNSRAYISDAIESVLEQTYKNFEIIVIDDGSCDGTRELIESCYPIARFMRTDHGGVSKARNTGIRNAYGEFIAFLDADDIWIPTKLEKQINYFNKDPDVAMVFTGNSYFDSSGAIDFHAFKMDKRDLMQGHVPSNIFLFSGVSTPTVIVKKIVFDGVGYFDEELNIAEDDNMWIRISSKYKIGLIDEVLVKVRRNHISLTTDIVGSIRGVEKNIELLRTKYKCFDENIQNFQEIFDKKYSKLHNSMGYYHFGKNEFQLARGEYRRSIYYDPRNLKSYKYFLLSFLPTRLIDAIRRYKRKLSL